MNQPAVAGWGYSIYTGCQRSSRHEVRLHTMVQTQFVACNSMSCTSMHTTINIITNISYWLGWTDCGAGAAHAAVPPSLQGELGLERCAMAALGTPIGGSVRFCCVQRIDQQWFLPCSRHVDLDYILHGS